MRHTYTRFIVMLAGLACLSSPAHSQTPKIQRRSLRVFTAVPRVMGRTARNMVTFHDREAAAEEWGQMIAVANDLLSSARSTDRVPGRNETSPTWPGRPSHRTWVLEGSIGALLEASATQWNHELLDGHRYYGLKQVPFVASGVLHGLAAQHNWATLSDYNVRSHIARIAATHNAATGTTER